MLQSRTIFSPTVQVRIEAAETQWSMYIRTEVSDLETGSVLGWDGVDGEMGVDQSHLVKESLRCGLALRPFEDPQRRG